MFSYTKRYDKTSNPAADPARKQAVIYARVSSKEQEKEGFSIPAQLKLLKEYAAANGFAVAQEYVDVETAKQTGRAAFGEMVAYLKAHPSVRVMLVEKTDRLYRNLKDWVTVDELDVEMHFPKEGVVLSRESRSSEKFMHGIKVLMAKNYIDNLSEEARKGMQEKAEQGIWPTVAPLGYRNVAGPDGKKIIEPDPDSAPIIARLFEWYATGDVVIEGGCGEGEGGGPRLSKERCGGSGEYRAHHLAQPHLHRRVRMERPSLPGQAPAPGLARTMGARAGRPRWPSRQEEPAGETRFCVLRPYHLRALRLLDRRGDQEATLRLLSLHRIIRAGATSRYVREEVIEQQFTDLLGRLKFDDEVLEWVREALDASHADERREHEEAIKRLSGRIRPTSEPHPRHVRGQARWKGRRRLFRANVG